MTTLNLGYLATFRLVHQRGSFSAAADVLGLSQPAVSLQIRQLEQFLQTRLVERTGRGIKATAPLPLARGRRPAFIFCRRCWSSYAATIRS